MKKHGTERIIEVFILRVQLNSMPEIGLGLIKIIELLIGGNKISPGISKIGLKFHNTLIMLYCLFMLLSRHSNFAQMQLDMGCVRGFGSESAGPLQVFFCLIKTLIFLNQYLSQ